MLHIFCTGYDRFSRIGSSWMFVRDHGATIDIVAYFIRSRGIAFGERETYHIFTPQSPLGTATVEGERDTSASALSWWVRALSWRIGALSLWVRALS